MNTPLRIALVHAADARSVRTWSGTAYFSKQAFQQYVGDVVDLTPAPFSVTPYKVAGQVIKTLAGRRYDYAQDRPFAQRLGKHFSQILTQGKYDLVFSPAGSATLAYLQTDVPIIYYSDATWRVLHDYYYCYTNVLPRMAKAADLFDRLSIERASLALFSSDWAARSAVHDYQADPSKVHTVFIGANLMDPPTRAQALQREASDRIHLLMVGVSWENKGGAIALQTLQALLSRGKDAWLTVVGCKAPEGVEHPRMRVIPFLNKQIPAEQERFQALWRESTVFILPTRFEAAGIVFCEAGAYGLPVVATATGGVGSLVKEGVNGYTLSPESGGEEYAKKILEITSDAGAYRQLCHSSREEYEKRLNWDVWGARVAEIIETQLPQFRGRTKWSMLQKK